MAAVWEERNDVIPEELQGLLEQMIKAALTSRPKQGIQYFADYLESELIQRTLTEIQHNKTQDNVQDGIGGSRLQRQQQMGKAERNKPNKSQRKSKCTREKKGTLPPLFVRPYAEQYECTELCPFHNHQPCDQQQPQDQGDQGDQGAGGESVPGESPDCNSSYKPYRAPKRCGKLPEYFRVRREQKKFFDGQKKKDKKMSMRKEEEQEDRSEEGDKEEEEDDDRLALLKEYNDTGIARLINDDNPCKDEEEEEEEEGEEQDKDQPYGPHPGSHNVMYSRKRPLHTDMEDKAIQCDSDMEPGDIGYVILDEDDASIHSYVPGEEEGSSRSGASSRSAAQDEDLCGGGEYDDYGDQSALCDIEDVPTFYPLRDLPDNDADLRQMMFEGSPDGDDMPAGYPAPCYIHDTHEYSARDMTGSGECARRMDTRDCPAAYPEMDEPDTVPGVDDDLPSRYPDTDAAEGQEEETPAQYAYPDWMEGDDEDQEADYPPGDAPGSSALATGTEEEQATYPPVDHEEGYEEQAAYPRADHEEGYEEQVADYAHEDHEEGYEEQADYANEDFEQFGYYPEAGMAFDTDEYEEVSEFPVSDQLDSMGGGLKLRLEGDQLVEVEKEQEEGDPVDIIPLEEHSPFDEDYNNVVDNGDGTGEPTVEG